MPTIYINHGGGPMPLLGQQPAIAAFLSAYTSTLPQRPSAVVVATAHWEEAPVTVSAAQAPEMLYDYGGFPPETYAYEYNAPGHPRLAERILELCRGAGIAARSDTSRGRDHGVFVPMMLMLPEADVPVVALSVRAGQSAEENLALGAALSPLRDEGVLLVGSGVSFHNFKYLFARDPHSQSAGVLHSQVFDAWLHATLTGGDTSPSERLSRLSRWESAPSAREAHPRGGAEHLMPLFVAAGAAGGALAKAVGPTGVCMEGVADFAISQFEWRD